MLIGNLQDLENELAMLNEWFGNGLLTCLEYYIKKAEIKQAIENLN